MQERKSVGKQGLVIERLRGAEIGDAEWTAFYAFYQDTVGAAAYSELCEELFLSLECSASCTAFYQKYPNFFPDLWTT